MPEDFTDSEKEICLKLLHSYVVNDPELTLDEIADDLAMSMNVTTDEADRYRREINELVF